MPVTLVPYDTTWPLEFAAEADRIERACAGLPIRLEHIGSTAIPGMSAKPVIDILAGRPGNMSGEKYVAAFRQLGASSGAAVQGSSVGLVRGERDRAAVRKALEPAKDAHTAGCPLHPQVPHGATL